MIMRIFIGLVLILFLCPMSGCGDKSPKGTKAAQRLCAKGLELKDTDKKKALAYYNAAVKAAPNYKKARLSRALLLNQMNKKDDAIRDFKKVMSLDKSDPFPAQMLAKIYRDRGDRATADKYDEIFEQRQQISMGQARESALSGGKTKKKR